jgi:sugar lactone lactonase YvrE
MLHFGTRITWQRADLSIQYGVIDFLHTDADGTVWAFCTRPDGGWVAVNRKYLTTIEEERP